MPAVSLWIVLVQFLARLVLGMVAALLLIPARQVSGDYFRLKGWILMGLGTVMTLTLASQRPLFAPISVPVWLLLSLAGGIAGGAYLSSVGWLYGSQKFGRLMLAVVGIAALALAGLLVRGPTELWYGPLEVVTSGLLIGGTLTTMLLGHWYLNSPQMDLVPIWRLVHWLAVTLVARAIVAGVGDFALEASATVPFAFWALRWTAGLVLPAILCLMVRGTLRVPNTQSATGILYAMLVLVFIGELVAQLSAASTVIR